MNIYILVSILNILLHKYHLIFPVYECLFISWRGKCPPGYFMQGPIFKLGWDQTHYRPRYIFLIQCVIVSYCSRCHSSLASEPFLAQVWLSLGLTLHTQNTLLKVWSPDTPQCQEDPISFDIGAAGSTHNTHLPGSLPRLLRPIPHHPWEWAKHLPLSSYHHCLCQVFSSLC